MTPDEQAALDNARAIARANEADYHRAKAERDAAVAILRKIRRRLARQSDHASRDVRNFIDESGLV